MTTASLLSCICNKQSSYSSVGLGGCQTWTSMCAPLKWLTTAGDCLTILPILHTHTYTCAYSQTYTNTQCLNIFCTLHISPGHTHCRTNTAPLQLKLSTIYKKYFLQVLACTDIGNWHATLQSKAATTDGTPIWYLTSCYLAKVLTLQAQAFWLFLSYIIIINATQVMRQ